MTSQVRIFRQIRNCSCKIGVVDQLETAIAAALTGPGAIVIISLVGRASELIPKLANFHVFGAFRQEKTHKRLGIAWRNPCSPCQGRTIPAID
jgi:hypothetical protein